MEFHVRAIALFLCLSVCAGGAPPASNEPMMPAEAMLRRLLRQMNGQASAPPSGSDLLPGLRPTAAVSVVAGAGAAPSAPVARTVVPMAPVAAPAAQVAKISAGVGAPAQTQRGAAAAGSGALRGNCWCAPGANCPAGCKAFSSEQPAPASHAVAEAGKPAPAEPVGHATAEADKNAAPAEPAGGENSKSLARRLLGTAARLLRAAPPSAAAATGQVPKPRAPQADAKCWCAPEAKCPPGCAQLEPPSETQAQAVETSAQSVAHDSGAAENSSAVPEDIVVDSAADAAAKEASTAVADAATEEAEEATEAQPARELPSVAAKVDGSDAEPRDWAAFVAKVDGSDKVAAKWFSHAGRTIRGLSAARRLRAGENILEIPSQLVLSAKHRTLQSLYAERDKKVQLGQAWQLAGFLAAEAQLGESSPWARYLEHLPKLDEFKEWHPLWASKYLITSFQQLPLTQLVAKYQHSMRKEWKEWKAFMRHARRTWKEEGTVSASLKSLRLAAANVTRDDFAWAFTVVLTRGFNDGRGAALVPVADDLNTDVPKHLNVHLSRREDGRFEVVTKRAVDVGDELLMAYVGQAQDNEGLEGAWGFSLGAENSERVSALDFQKCRKLEDSVKKRLPQGRGDPTTCAPSPKEPQPRILCALAALAREHCPYATELHG